MSKPNRPRWRRRKWSRAPKRPILRFTPWAWSKLIYLRDLNDAEVGGFGITPTEPLLVEDIGLVRQVCTTCSVQFEDASVADYFDQQVDRGLTPNQFARIWVHTHPGHSPQPSSTDEQTFGRCFGQADWALMFILARGGQTYVRLRFTAGPGADVLSDVDIEYAIPFPASDHAGWLAEYQQHVTTPPLLGWPVDEAWPEPAVMDLNIADWPGLEPVEEGAHEP